MERERQPDPNVPGLLPSEELLLAAVRYGPTITEVKPSSRNPEKWSIRVGRIHAGTIDQRHITEIGLAVGMQWTESLAARIAAAQQEDKARRYALRALAQRGMSRKAMDDKLTGRGYAPEVRSRVIADMVRIGLLDEEGYARTVALTTLRARPAGKRLLEQSLRRRGVAPEVVRSVVEEVTVERDPLEDALELAMKRARVMPARLDAAARSRRIYALLARRGFDPDVCREATRRAVRIDSED